MLRVIPVGKQNFSELRTNNCFYVDKTKFIRDWWNSYDDVTLITRPRRFGKTLMLDTVKTFFSPKFANRSDLFTGLEIWKDEKFRKLQGKIPVIHLSFSRINNNNYADIIARIKTSLADIYDFFTPLIDINAISTAGKEIFTSVHKYMTDDTAQDSLHYLCKFLTVQHNIKPIILLDEYDTPLLEAWLHGYWDQLVSFMRGFFNATFKDNPWLERGLITGITRVAKESIFSDMNNLKVVSITSSRYDDCFGFTEQEVFSAMDEYGLTNKEEVKKWYDGFIFGTQKEIYNPWSIVNFLSEKKLETYWKDSSSNSLVGDLVVNGDFRLKKDVATLLEGKDIETEMDEQIIFSKLYSQEGAIWSLLMASGYLKPLSYDSSSRIYNLKITNFETKIIFENLISDWFQQVYTSRNEFIKALLNDNLKNMNKWMNDISKNIFSFFDTGINKKNKTENFYHAFFLGLMVNLKNKYKITSNRESGYGRYDVMLSPKSPNNHGIVIEFKTFDKGEENDLQETCTNALKQIYEKHYTTELNKDVSSSNKIYAYGFAFKGKKVLICGGLYDNIDWQSIID